MDLTTNLLREFAPILSAFAALISVAVASGSVLVTIWLAGRQRSHDRAALMPLLRVDAFGLSDEHGRIVIQNHGSGPAILDSVDFRIDDETLPSELPARFERLQFYGFPEKMQLTHVATGDGLGPGQAMTILSFSEAPVATTWARLGLTVKFRSVFGEQFSYQHDNADVYDDPKTGPIFAELRERFAGKPFPDTQLDTGKRPS